MKKLLMVLVLILSAGLLYVYAEDTPKSAPKDKAKAETPITAASAAKDSVSGATEEDTDVSGYKPKASVAATADVSGRRLGDSAIATTSSEEKDTSSGK